MSKTIAIEITRYEELAAKEEKLRLLEKAILNLPYSAQTENVKEIFSITKEKEVIEE